MFKQNENYMGFISWEKKSLYVASSNAKEAFPIKYIFSADTGRTRVIAEEKSIKSMHIFDILTKEFDVLDEVSAFERDITVFYFKCVDTVSEKSLDKFLSVKESKETSSIIERKRFSFLRQYFINEHEQEVALASIKKTFKVKIKK